MLPHVAGVSEDIRHIYRKFSMKVVLKFEQTLRSMLIKVKDALAR
jgi:hypothetical protein